MKRDALIVNKSRENPIQIQSSRKDLDTNSDKTMLIAMEWLAIVGKQHSPLEMEQLCLKRMNIEFVDRDDEERYDDIPDTSISDCARTFRYDLPSVEAKEVNSSAERKRASTTPRLEFVHITKTGGSAVERAAAAVGITWGACHYMSLEEVGCSSPDVPYEAPDYQSYALTSPWHTPPKLLETYVDGSKDPYNDADLFTIIGRYI